jgi:hypothetical protein
MIDVLPTLTRSIRTVWSGTCALAALGAIALAPGCATEAGPEGIPAAKAVPAAGDAPVEASADELGLYPYPSIQNIVITRGVRGGAEELCGEGRNTSPYVASVNVALSFTTSISVTGGINATILKDWVTANLSITGSKSDTYTSSVTVPSLPPGKTVRFYCYAIGNYAQGDQTVTWWPEKTPSQVRHFTAFAPHKFGFRISS